MVGKIERLQLNVPFKDDETRHERIQHIHTVESVEQMWMKFKFLSRVTWWKASFIADTANDWQKQDQKEHEQTIL